MVAQNRLILLFFFLFMRSHKIAILINTGQNQENMYIFLDKKRTQELEKLNQPSFWRNSS